MSDEVPEGWATAGVADVINDIQAGFASGKKDLEGGLAHLRMNNIGRDGELVLDLVRTVPERLARPHHDLRRGDVLVCTTNSATLVGKPAYFDLPGRFAFSNHLTRLRPDPDLVDGRFLRWNLWLHWKSGLFNDCCKHWVNQSAIPKEALLRTEVVLPPLPEQRRIIAKLEELLAKADACQKRLAKVPVLLKRFRQAVLAAACSGRLTADWRQAQTDVEPATALLEGDQAGQGEDEQADFDGPTGWARVRFGALVGAIRGGSTVPPAIEATDFPILRSSSVRPGAIDLNDVRFVRAKDSQCEENFLRDGDLLFTRLSGSLEYLANCAVVRGLGSRRIQYPDRIFCARLKVREMASYVELCFGSPAVRAELTEGAKSSAGHQRVSIADIANQRIPLAPLAEQLEIVRRVGAAFALAAEIEARFVVGQGHVARLTPTLLAKAFAGELVPTEAELARREGRSFEPASVLLLGGHPKPAIDVHLKTGH